jgi:hypothetical protein
MEAGIADHVWMLQELVAARFYSELVFVCQLANEQLLKI